MADRRIRRRERTRRSLLDAASELIATRGLDQTRVEDVTQAADLGKGAFYNYFDSKEALVAALLTEAVQELDSVYLRDVPRAPSAEQRLRLVVRQHEALFTARPVVLQLFHQVRGLLLRRPGDGSLQAIVRDYLERVARRLGGEPEVVPSEEDLDRVAAVIGTVTGYHSFRIAAGLAPRAGTVEHLIVDGARRDPRRA